MKTVFFISTIDLYLGNSAGSSRVMNMARALSSKGNRVFLASLWSDLKKPYLKDDLAEIFHFDKSLPSSTVRFLNKLFFVFHAFTFCFKIRKLIRSESSRENAVVILYPSSDSLFDYCCLFTIHFLMKYKLYYEVNELRRSYLVNRSYSSNFLIKVLEMLKNKKDWIFYTYHEKLTRYYSGLLIISKNLENYYSRYNNNTLLIPILTGQVLKEEKTKNQFIHGNIFKICFSGSINLQKEGLDILYDSIKRSKEKYPKIELHLIGPIAKNEEHIIKQVLPEKYGIPDSVSFHGLVPQNSVIEELKKYNLLVLPRPENLQTKYGFSTKLSDYLVSGVPVLVTDVSDNGLYIKDGINGFIVTPGDPVMMSTKINWIIDNYQLFFDTVVRNAFDTVNHHFYYGTHAERLSNFLAIH